MTPPVERQFTLKIDSPAKANVYLSTSWHADRGLDLAYRLVRSFDQESIRMVGDARGLPTQEASRIRRIMADCQGMLCVLPYRSDHPSDTSPYILEELRIAVDIGRPLTLVFDRRIGLVRTDHAAAVELAFPGGTEPLTIPSHLLCGIQSYDVDVPTAEAYAEAGVVPLRQRVLEMAEGSRIPAYAFLITRLKGDFARARHAIAMAVESATGLPCIWIDAPGYSTNVSDTVERTRLLIQHAQFVVADLSFSEDNPDYYNPTRSHEVGIAVALQKPLFLTAQLPRRDPYHALSVAQVEFWADEADLFTRLRDTLYAARENVGRHSYNWDLPRPGDHYTPRLGVPQYRADVGEAHAAPSASQLNRTESWILAVCFALSALAASVLVDRYTGFGDTFDFAALVGAVFALTFSSDLNTLFRRQLARSVPLRWVIVLATAVLLVAAIFSPPPSPRPSRESPPRVAPAAADGRTSG
jgi:hypothetical protein